MKALALLAIAALLGALGFSVWYFSPPQIAARARARHQLEREERAAEQAEIRRLEAFNLDRPRTP